ncbi:thermonuclease family protein [Undibacterium sp. BYS107W]|uniref:Thermonuclease family protein n=2 Tax=Undibacterium baiyunense TaxID=2828731 RepID=A0A941I3H1_9BURK|nr:thermonuclease family protein [Undibacterium baiyunense]
MQKLIFSILLTLCIPTAYAHKVVGISDGDTMTLLVEGKPLKIRLANIDAPERKQAFGQKSKESLSDICWGTDATYEAQTVDRYGRTVAVVFCNDVEANTEQVRRGMAWVYPKYNKDSMLPAIEADARDKKIGLWSDREPVAPWEFRRQLRTR